MSFECSSEVFGSARALYFLFRNKRTRDLWNTRRGIQIQTELDQPSRQNGQHQTSEIRPQLQT